MVEFSLPANSKITKGVTHKAPEECNAGQAI